jgi:formylglycine-generating enzyme required for sulfatase activity
MKRATTCLLAFGLLSCATAARAQEKSPDAPPKADPLAAPWSALRSPWQPPKNNKEFAEKRRQAIAELAKRQAEVYKQIDEGKIDEAFPTLWDVYILEEFLTEYVRGGQSKGLWEGRAEKLLDPAGKERRVAQRLRVEEAAKKSREEARQEYMSALKAGMEANPEWGTAERRLKEATGKLETLKVNVKGEPKDSSRKLTAEETTAAAAAVKEYREAEGAAKRFSNAFHKGENERLRRAAEGDLHGYGVMMPDNNQMALGGNYWRERWICKQKMGWFGLLWLLLGLDPAPDPALPRIDESVRKPGTAKTVDLGNNVKIELVWIPPGEYMMGSPMSEPGRSVDERLHRVKLTKGFWMGKYEVTQEQWQRVMGNNPSWFKNAGPQAPVENVRIDQAQKFMANLGEMTAGKDGGAGGKFRLPTEAEWEWACRAGATTALDSGKMTIKGGNNSPELSAVAWYAGNSGVDYEGGVLSTLWMDKERDHHSAGTHPVGQKKPNAWGLHDMLGNVQEWCADWYFAYPSQAATDPTGPKSHMGDSTCGDHVVRGGGWASGVRLCRSAARSYTFHDALWRNATIGFRVVLEDTPAEKGK